MVSVSMDCCINMFFKNWNYYLLFSDAEYIFDRGRGCLFSMQRGGIMKCICRTVWQNIKEGKRDACMNVSPLSPSAQQPQGRRLESSGSLIRRNGDWNEWQHSIILFSFSKKAGSELLFLALGEKKNRFCLHHGVRCAFRMHHVCSGMPHLGACFHLLRRCSLLQRSFAVLCGQPVLTKCQWL